LRLDSELKNGKKEGPGIPNEKGVRNQERGKRTSSKKRKRKVVKKKQRNEEGPVGGRDLSIPLRFS